jgi:hypothetical protein
MEIAFTTLSTYLKNIQGIFKILCGYGAAGQIRTLATLEISPANPHFFYVRAF